ncbi:MAG: hypothetical protein GC171_09115 [Terrimonas sp.]|nr:hypothetical protein [Terrimonas sp.]
MPNSRKRKGHHHHQQQGLSTAPKQKLSGHLIWSVLMAVFAVIIGLMAAGTNIIVLVICAVVGAALGYAIGKSMEKTFKE